MYKNYVIIVVLIVWVACVSGCASSTRVEMDYGTSYKLSKMNQILNPDAEKNLTPVVGIDGQAAQAAIDSYRKSFGKTAPGTPPVSSSMGTSGTGVSTKY